MTKDQNKICALFVGKCWHEWKQTRWYVEYNQDNEYTCMLCGMVSTGITLDNPDYSLRGQDWWELWDRVTKDEKFFFRFKDFCSSKKGNHQDMFLVRFVNNLRENVVAYLKYALDNGLHEELFKMECPCPPEYKGDQEIDRVCPYCSGTGTIDTPLAKAVKESSK